MLQIWDLHNPEISILLHWGKRKTDTRKRLKETFVLKGASLGGCVLNVDASQPLNRDKKGWGHLEWTL